MKTDGSGRMAKIASISEDILSAVFRSVQQIAPFGD
jgi:hypothetical protein